MLRGIIPIVITPFDSLGQLDEDSLRRVVRFELEGGVHGIGVGGFASEAYKLTDEERFHCAQIVADEVQGRVPLVIGISPNSTEAAIEQARTYASLKPEALMTLPPNTMNNDEAALVDHYIVLGNNSEVPIMIQQSPQIAAYAHCQLSTESLAQIARHSANVRYFKIEGMGSAKRIHALRQRVDDTVKLFGGVGGIALREELLSGAGGLLPGVGFNEFFLKVWEAWETNDHEKVHMILSEVQPLVEAVSGFGHEFSLHARKYLLARAGIITHVTVRRPTVRPDTYVLENIGRMVDDMKLRIAKHP
jgi:dihydrodipicolinate synthase/N-acetylneuraminate lyase